MKSSAITVSQFLQIPFGVYMTPSYLTMMINETLKRLEFCFAYVNDIIIYSTTKKGTPRPHQTDIYLPTQSKHQIKTGTLNPRYTTLGIYSHMEEYTSCPDC